MGGQSISLPQRESLLRLFARLTLAIGQPLSRKTLAFSLWPDESESEALANLRRHLYLLQRALPGEAQSLLLISPQTVCWADSPACWLDVRAFERESEDLDELEDMVSLYRGDLAMGVDTDEWILARREELRSRYRALLKKLSLAYLEQNQLERALNCCRKLTEQDRWDEEAVRLQMTLETLAGNRAAALNTYQRLADGLKREIHAQPMPETMTLYSDILNNRLPRLDLPKKPSPEALFISRAPELAQLQTLLAEARKRQGKIAFISGEAGVGKTSLLQEALRRFMEFCGEDLPRVFWGYCPPPASDSPAAPYAPWKQIFAAAAPLLARNAEIPPEWLNRLLPLIPDLSLLRPGLLAPTQPDAAELRAALRQGITFLALEQPLILILEDVHWADDASLELLADLADTCQTLPLLLLLTHRAAEAPAALLNLKRDLRRRRCTQEIPLRAFDENETRLFLEKMLGREIVTAALLDEIQRYAAGLPLLLREAAESLRQAQSMVRRSPASLRETIRLRLTKLGDQAQHMLEAAAVLGFSFAHLELETMLGWPAPAFASVLDDLQAQRLILDAVSAGFDDYTFPHQLIHQIILESISAKRASLLHEQAARALETVHAGQTGFAAEIAAHYQAANQPVAAARFWLTHAQELTDLAAFEQAGEAIERAIALIGSSDTREVRELSAQAALLRGVLAHYRGQAAEALPLLENALTTCREFPALYGNALIRQAYALYTCDRYPEAHQAASQALEIARLAQDGPAVLRALNIRGIIALMMGRMREAIQDLQQALSLEESTASPSAQTVQSLNHLGTALVFVQEYAQAAETLTKTVELAQEGGLKRLESAALTMLGQISLNQGRYSEAIRLYYRAIETAGESYLPGMWGKFAGRGAAFLRMGSLPEARKDFERGLEIARQVESRYGQLLMRVYLTLTSLAGGCAPLASLPQLEAEAAAYALHAVVLLTSLARAALWRLLGDGEQSLAAAQRAAQAAQASGVPQFLQNAQLEMLLTQSLVGELPDRTALQALSEAAQTAGEVPQQARAALALAALLYRQGQPAEALSACQRALNLARSCPDQPLIGESLLLSLRLREALGQSGQTQPCRAELLALAQTAYAPLALALDADSDLRQVILAACGASL